MNRTIFIFVALTLMATISGRAFAFDKEDLSDIGALLKFMKANDNPDYGYFAKHIAFYSDNCGRAEKLQAPTMKTTSGGSIGGVGYHHGQEAQIYSALLSDFHGFYKNVTPWLPALSNLTSLSDLEVAGHTFGVTGLSLKHAERVAPTAKAYLNDMLHAITQADYRQCVELTSAIRSTGAI